jgi:drug/metabolite transporter (DMT)-like permease
MTVAAWLAMLSSLCFGIALVTGRVGLRSVDARAGAAVSIPTATLLFALAAPFVLDAGDFDVRATLWFVLVGFFFPAVVTILTFRSNERLGPTITSAVSGTAPLFALIAAALLLRENVPQRAALASAAVVAGIALLSWKPGALRRGVAGWALLWPIAGAVVRGFAQAGVKAGLLLWPNPFAAGLIGYAVSTATVIGVDRFGRSRRPRLTKQAVGWFAATGLLNGGAVLLMYAALSVAPVSLVAPVVATYPLITTLVSAALLREEAVSWPMAAGAVLTVLAIVYLVGSESAA